jgi:predicted DNA-binding transcriptional regulator YafY
MNYATKPIITKVAEKKITIRNAAKLLNKSRRTIERYLQQYYAIGIQFIVHKNSGKYPVNKIADAVVDGYRNPPKNSEHLNCV